MKYLSWSLITIILGIPAFARPVPPNTAEIAATWAAESVWGPLNLLERETLFMPDGSLSAYCYTFGRSGVYQIDESIIRAGYNLRQSGRISKGWDLARDPESYAYAIVSADDEYGPVLEMCDGLPAHLVFKWDVLSKGEAVLGSAVEMMEFYYLFPLENWFEVNTGLESAVINPRRMMMVTPDEFAGFETLHNFPGNSTASTYWELVTTSPVPVPEESGYISGVPNYNQTDTDCGPHSSAQAVGYWDDHTYMSAGPWDLLIDTDFWGLRDEMRSAMGWVPGSGVTISEIRDGIITVCNDPAYNNNYNFDAALHYDPEYTVCSNAVDDGRPGVIGVYLHPVYGNHAMTLVGYNDTPTQMVQVHDNWPPSNDEPWLEWNATFNAYVDVFPDGGTPMPITLLDFVGNYCDGNVELTWITLSEIDCYGYNILRNTGGSFQKITAETILAQGNPGSVTTYNFNDVDVSPGRVTTYALQTSFIDGRTEISSTVTVKTLVYKLAQNAPNPFNLATSIRYVVPESGFVTLTVYDVKGSVVETLVKAQREADIYTVAFDGSNLASGIYFYRLEVGDYTAIRKMVLLK